MSFKIKNKKLQQKILKMASTDQKARKQFINDSQNKRLAKRIYNCDTKNIIESKEIIKKYGWPTFGLVGKRASDAFWLLVQHSDRDIKFQKKCLALLEKAVENKQAYPKNLAFLVDRILSAEGKKQKFGTQFIFKDGKAVVKPVQDRKNLDRRRAKYGLNTIEEGTKDVNKGYAKMLSLMKK
ncbi:MAG: hypothetical protein NUV64_02395 [Parcubacteria group bacterium]|nr:hypothetical protein [Parcubacteria group bacterium]MCR4343079.1 hypothetical protein [Patescibacteria group bacterium]